MSGEAKLFRCIKAGKIVKFVPPWNSPIELIEPWARTKPGRLALTGLIDGKRWITRTYCQLLRRVLTIARGLCEQPGERIAVACASHVTGVETVLAALTARRSFVPLDLCRQPLNHQFHKLTDSKAGVLIVPGFDEMPDLLVDRINDVKGMFPHLRIWSLGENRQADVNLLATGPEASHLTSFLYPGDAWRQPIALMYSPGRHGQPKGYLYQADALGANISAVQEWLKLNGKSRLLMAMELDSCDGLIPVLATLAAGGTAILYPQIDAGAFWKVICDSDADMVRATPALIEELLDHHSSLAGINRSNLKFIITGSAYLPRQIGLRFFETFDLPLLQSYGTAETGGYVLGMAPGLSWREYELALRDNVAGPELPYCNVVLRPDGETEETVRPGHGEGVLHVRGHSVSCGWWDGHAIRYWDEPWLRTADMAMHSSWQEQQYYQIRGRLEDTLIIDNQRFWPAYIERSLLDTFQFLRDCVVMTLGDRDGRRKLCAVVVLPPDLPNHRRSELLALMEARLIAGGVSGLTDKSTPKDLLAFDERLVPRRFDGHPDRAELHRLIEQQAQQGMVAS